METASETPAGMAVAEIDRIRNCFREAVAAYSAKVDADLASIQNTLSAHAGDEKLGSSKTRDIRDMLTLLRNMQFKPEKGRRKDIKKIDSLVGDLQMLVENW